MKRSCGSSDTKELLDGEQFGSPKGQDPVVKLNVFIRNIYEIDEQKFLWTGKIDLEAQWHDPTLVRDRQDGENWPDTDNEFWPRQCPFVAGENKRWTPRLGIDNLIEKKAEETWYKVYEVTKRHRHRLESPLVVFRTVIHGVFTFDFDPHKLPFDVQELPIRVVSNRTSADLSDRHKRRFARLVFDGRPGCPSKIFGRANLLAGQWDLDGEIKVYEGATSQRSSYCRYPVVELRARMHRRASFYVYTVWLPNFLLVTLAFLVLTIENDEGVSERVGLIVTLLLASIGYRASIELPRTSTLSWLDAYLLACIAALFTLAVFAFWEAEITRRRLAQASICASIGASLDLCLHLRKPNGTVEGTRRSTVALTTAIFVALAAVFIRTPTPNHELLKNLDSPVEICFLIWLFLNLEFFLLYFIRSPLLQPSINCAPEPRESLIAVPIAKLAAAATHGPGTIPARAATSPARDRHLHRVAFATSTRSTLRSAPPSIPTLPRFDSIVSTVSVSSVDSESYSF